MPTLPKDLRSKLEKAVRAARPMAAEGAASALTALGVGDAKKPAHLDAAGETLRRRLRARGRQAGDVRRGDDSQETGHLVQECAYEHWHRMLFARFLAENDLLIHPEMGVSVSVEECEELARDEGLDLWELAARFAQHMLPEVFRQDDPVLQVRLPIEIRNKLTAIVSDLPAAVFTASDSLGWTYQFWQADQKEIVNKSGNKIGADELPSVTQLFTEDYMVDFLLDNTLGAWQAGKVLAENPSLAGSAKSEDELRQACSLPGCPWTYLRFIKGEDGKWLPAAGTFDRWPRTAAELKCLDPCMGSGHFVVAMFERLVALRLAEENLDEAAAVAAVIRDNLFGLEIDPRCTQIAAFNLALAAWRRVGHCQLPALHLACSGLAPNTREADWLAIAGDNQKLQRGMARLYRMFQKAAVLGSLINPHTGDADLLVAAFHELQPLLEKALAQENKDDTAHELAVTAHGLAKAAEILAGRFTLVATNVPYLGFQKQDEVLVDYCERVHPDAKADLATCFVERCLEFCSIEGSTALVTPQNWLFLNRFRHLRKHLLEKRRWHVIARLGEHGFNSPQAAGAFTAMVVLSHASPSAKETLAGLDVAKEKGPDDKAAALLTIIPISALQSESLHRPDSTVSFEARSSLPLLSEYADSLTGAHTLDIERFRIYFWELERVTSKWNLHVSTPVAGKHYSGMEYVSYTREKGEEFASLAAAMKEEGFLGGWLSGNKAWGKPGIACSWMRQLPASLYLGTVYDNSAAAIIPHKKEWIPAIWCFCSSAEYSAEVRKINQKVQVANSTLVKVPFDLAHWQKVAAEKYPHGLPKPFSSDPTQWLFNGHPSGADDPLHVAVARLLGYQWPRQTGSSFPECPALGADGLKEFADSDGIVCLNPVRGEDKAADRLREILRAALRTFDERQLVAKTGPKGSTSTTLEDWLRDEFFEQHCDIFYQRPFLWHLWDGRKDGFHAIVNYHKLTSPNGAGRRTLEALTHGYLGDWITRQRAAVTQGEGGADDRLAAALELHGVLEKILAGEPPYDLFIRWKPLHQQPIGWEPDINDGVRLNARPFLATDLSRGKKGAGLFRSKVNLKWAKDRGNEPMRTKDDFPWFWTWDEKSKDFAGGSKFDGNRWNDLHYTTAFKQAARDRQKKS